MLNFPKFEFLTADTVRRTSTHHRAKFSRNRTNGCGDMTKTTFARDALLASWYAVVVCPSVRLSHAGTVSKRLDESSWFLARSRCSTYPTLCCKEIRVFPKIMVLPPCDEDYAMNCMCVDCVVMDTWTISKFGSREHRRSLRGGGVSPQILDHG